MPVLTRGASNMIIMPNTYSPSAVSRVFKVIEEIELAGVRYAVIYDAETPRAAIIKIELEEFNGSPRHRVIASLDLKRRKNLGAEEIISVERFWEDDEVMQVEGVVVDPQLRERGLATLLYEVLVLKCDIILMSDNEQYDAGKILWQRIARESKKLSVFVLDTDESKFYPYDGERIAYDGVAIEEDKIWSIHPDKSLYGVVLVAEDKRKIAEIAA